MGNTPSFNLKDKNMWKDRSCVSVEDHSRKELEQLFEVTDILKRLSQSNDEDRKKLLEICKGKILACVFYESSTRTNCSFTTAMYRLGGNVIQINGTTSSVSKGETLADTMRCLECYSDILVLRHPMKGSAKEADDALFRPLLNAGDGAGEHPTQALLDIYTICSEQGRIDKLVITMLGDLKYGRTTHSLAKLLSHYDVQINFVSPSILCIPDEILEYLKEKNISFQQYTNLEECIETTDVLYVTRVQKERFDDPEEYKKCQGSFIVNSKSLEKAKQSMSILHPLPRVGEIAEEVDTDPRAAYFRQMANGMFVRMALIALIIGKI